MIQPTLLPAEVQFTNGTKTRCRLDRCFMVDDFGRCPVTQIRPGDVIVEGKNHDEFRRVKSVTIDKEGKPWESTSKK
ncbi:MAG TPA: hypothetical protein DIT32_03570 [Peptococcaceae bacterium]|nr:hypothetical protein [Peptococcaceae bacterium]